jgi:hypothetical protein
MAIPQGSWAGAPGVTISATPTVLWPPNGKTAVVNISGLVSDTGTGIDSNSVSFNVQDEYGEVEPAGQLILNPDGTFSFTVTLIVRRLGRDKNGREYTVTVLVRDLQDAVGGAAAIVTVPHDRRQFGGNGKPK